MSDPNYTPIPLERSLLVLPTPKKGTNATAIKKAVYLEALKTCYGNLTLAAKATKIHKSTVFRWKNTDPVFAKRIEDMKWEIIEYAETKLIEQATKGKPNMLALIFLLKNNHPQYADKLKLSGQVDSNVNITGYEDLSDAELIRAVKEITAGTAKAFSRTQH